MPFEHVFCPACLWSGWDTDAAESLCPRCFQPVTIAQYDAEAIARYNAEHADDPTGREGL